MLVYTSVTKSYLPKARVLAKSVKHFHPDWAFVLLYSDDFPSGFDLANEPFDEVLTVQQLGLESWRAWVFQHSIVELCTAVKGPAAELLAMRPTVDKVMYIDPDIKVFNSLDGLETLLDEFEILLTPHLLDAETEVCAIQDNEISALKHGIYNLGFFAARTSGQGRGFIKWWADRLRTFCRDDISNGLFTDQRWCDLAPAFFSNLGIVRDRGYNVATWNIAHRPLAKSPEGVYFSGDVPLRFYHFTSYDSGNGLGMLLRYASTQNVAHELWDDYGNDLKSEGHGDVRYKGWLYGQFENGETIPLEARKLYRARPDLQRAFPDPFCVQEPCFLSWWKTEVSRVGLDGIRGSAKWSSWIRVGQAVSSPRTLFNLFIKALNVIKRDGIGGLVVRIKRRI